MKQIKKIGILTSGGDCGGLNAVIVGAANMAKANNIEIVAITNGYAGLYNLDEVPPVTLTDELVDEIRTARAGSVIGHSRVKISKIKDDNKYNKIKNNLEKYNIDALIIAGGDDTGSVAVDLSNNGVNCVHTPKTMDLDLQTYSVGGDSTINRISKFVNDLRTTAVTHNRVVIVEVFGRYAGHTAFRGGIGADADCILIPEVNVDYKVVYEHLKKRFTERLLNSKLNAASYIIVTAEGIKNSEGNLCTDASAATDSFGHQKLSGAGAYLKHELEKLAKQDKDYWKEIYKKAGTYIENINETPEMRDLLPGHLVRCGDSTPYDVSFGKQCGGSAVLLLLNNIFGVTVVGLDQGVIKYIPVKEAIVQRYVDLKDVDFHEKLGVCFGRTPIKNFNPVIEKVEGKISRYM